MYSPSIFGFSPVLTHNCFDFKFRQLREAIMPQTLGRTRTKGGVRSSVFFEMSDIQDRVQTIRSGHFEPIGRGAVFLNNLKRAIIFHMELLTESLLSAQKVQRVWIDENGVSNLILEW